MTADVLGVVADDLTGGAAIAGEIVRTGGACAQILRLGHHQPTRHIATVIETASRYIDPAESAERVLTARAELQAHGFGILMKKIDSTLKGNVATELAAFASAGAGTLVIAPACPAVSLSLKGGRQFRAGSPGRDVTEMLAPVLDQPPKLLTLDVVQNGPIAVADWFATAGSPAVVLADAVDDADLLAISVGSKLSGVVEFAGTYGLGAALSHLETSQSRVLPAGRAERLLVLAGSASSTTSEQLQRLLRSGRAEEIVIDVVALLCDERAEVARVAAAIACSSGAILVLHTDAQSTSVAVTAQRERRGWSERELAVRISAPFVSAIEAIPEAGVYFIGGETTGAICDRLGWSEFTTEYEVSAAVPLLSERMASRPFVLTKPGAFGRPSDLIDAADQLVASL